MEAANNRVVACNKAHSFSFCRKLCVLHVANNHVLASLKTHGFSLLQIVCFVASKQPCGSFC